MGQLASFSINSVYTNTPPVLITKIKDEITGEDNQALITEHAMVNYVSQQMCNMRYVPLYDIRCNFPDISAGHISLEYYPDLKGYYYTINEMLYRSNTNKVLDCGQRNYLRCALKYLSKYFFFDVTGSLNSYAHLVPPYIPKHFYDGCPKIETKEERCRRIYEERRKNRYDYR